jgi:MOSC domain-containing protein YiiM
MVTEPRLPCYKLGIKFGRTDIVKRFLASERTGFYFAVLREGDVGAGDWIELTERTQGGVNINQIVQLYTREKHNTALLRRAIATEPLPEGWKTYFQHRLEKLRQP